MKRQIPGRRWRPLCVAALLVGLSGCGPKEENAARALGFKQLDAAESAMKAHNYAAALKYYQQAYARGASVREAHLGIIRSLFALGRLGEAESHASRMAKSQPRDPDPLELAIQLNMLIGKLDVAHALLMKLDKLRPEGQLTILLKAEIYLASGFLTRAEQAIIEGESLHGQLPDWAFLRARIDLLRQYVEAGEEGYALAAETFRTPKTLFKRAYFEHVMGRAHRLEEILLEAQEIAEGDPTAYSALADFYASMGRYDESMAELGALRQTLGQPTPDLARRAASILLRTGEQAEAQGILRPVLNAQINDDLVARELALSYLLDNAPEKAAEVLLELMRARPDAAGTQYLLGLTEVQSDKPLSARKSFTAMLRADPDNLLARYGLALVGLRAQRWYDAEFQCTQILKVTPHDLIAGLIWATALKADKRLDAALVLKRWMLKHHPADKALIEKLVPLPPGTAVNPKIPPNLPRELLDEMLGER